MDVQAQMCPFSQKNFLRLCQLLPQLRSYIKDAVADVLCSTTLNNSYPSIPRSRHGESLFGLQTSRLPPGGHTHHLIYSANRSSSVLEQLSSSFGTIHAHPHFSQFLAHFRLHMLIPSLSCITREV